MPYTGPLNNDVLSVINEYLGKDCQIELKQYSNKQRKWYLKIKDMFFTTHYDREQYKSIRNIEEGKSSHCYLSSNMHLWLRNNNYIPKELKAFRTMDSRKIFIIDEDLYRNNKIKMT